MPPKTSRHDPIVLTFRIIGWLATFLASCAAIFGVWSWWWETNARAEEREVRQSALIDSAYSALSSLAPGDTNVVSSPRLDFAFKILSRYGQDAAIVGKTIGLKDLELSCGTFQITGDAVRLPRLRLDRATLVVTGTSIMIDEVTAIDSAIELSHPDAATGTSLISGDVKHSLVIAKGHAIVDVRALYTKIGNGKGQFTQNGYLGPIYLNVGDSGYPGYPFDRPFSPRQPPLEVFDLYPDEVSYPDGPRHRTGNYTDAFMEACPGGRCMGENPLDDSETAFPDCIDPVFVAEVGQDEGWSFSLPTKP